MRRRRVTFCALASIVVATFGGYRGATAAPFVDHFRFSVTAGPDGADGVDLFVAAIAFEHGTGGGLICGAAVGIDFDENKGGLFAAGWSKIQPFGLSPPSAAFGVTSDVGSLRANAASPDGKDFCVDEFIMSVPMKPGWSFDMVMFAPDHEMRLIYDQDYPRVALRSGSVSLTTSSGQAAAHSLVVGDPSDRGTGVGAAGVGAGDILHHYSSQKGLIGFIIPPDSATELTSGTWQAPDGRGGAWSSDSLARAQDSAFAGPLGAWEWTWKGAYAGFHASVMYGAFLELADWDKFRPLP